MVGQVAVIEWDARFSSYSNADTCLLKGDHNPPNIVPLVTVLTPPELHEVVRSLKKEDPIRVCGIIQSIDPIDIKLNYVDLVKLDV